MATALNTSNPEYITWEYQQVQVIILGGLRIEGLDRMRVTLKIQWKEQVVRHNLDLYNDAAVDKLVKRCAERFSLGTAFMGELVTALTNTLEQYRLEELKKGQVKEERSPMSSGKRNKIITFLQQPDLLRRTNELIGKKWSDWRRSKPLTDVSGLHQQEKRATLAYYQFGQQWYW